MFVCVGWEYVTHKMFTLPRISKNVSGCLATSHAASLLTTQGSGHIKEASSYDSYVGKHYVMTLCSYRLDLC